MAQVIIQGNPGKSIARSYQGNILRLFDGVSAPVMEIPVSPRTSVSGLITFEIKANNETEFYIQTFSGIIAAVNDGNSIPNSVSTSTQPSVGSGSVAISSGIDITTDNTSKIIVSIIPTFYGSPTHATVQVTIIEPNFTATMF